jgi:hypothetical protein
VLDFGPSNRLIKIEVLGLDLSGNATFGLSYNVCDIDVYAYRN